MYWKIRNFVRGFNEILYVYRSYFVFLLLILTSIFLLQTNPYPSMTFVRQRLIYISALMGTGISKVFREKEPAVAKLQKENIELAKRNLVLEDAYLENIRLRQMLGFQQKFPLQTIPANIIARNPDPALSTITLDKGSNDGLRQHQNVITEHGLVGVLTQVGERHAVCQILLDPNFRAASFIQRTRFNGVIHWPGRSNEVAFYGVLKNLDVKIGDVILTSEYSEFCLPNLKIGVVDEVNNEIEGIFKDIRLKTFVDFNTMENVFIITDTSIVKTKGLEKYFLGSD